jgi:hypothetical protein
MSVAGKYQVTITTPEETITGTLTLAEKDGSLEGSLVTGDHQSDFTHGNILENRIAWNMIVKTKYVTYPVDCSADADGKTIKGEIRTKTSGFFGLEGKAS